MTETEIIIALGSFAVGLIVGGLFTSKLCLKLVDKFLKEDL